MGYQVLARKYRPQRFADVAGQDHVTRTLMNALSQNRIAHGYIFSGHRGIGKPPSPASSPWPLTAATPSARLSAPPRALRRLRFLHRGPPGQRGRRYRDRRRHQPRHRRDSRAPRRRRYAPRATATRSTSSTKPTRLPTRPHALLKTLEEPPSHVIFMMATTSRKTFPDIRSRCQHFSFHAVNSTTSSLS